MRRVRNGSWAASAGAGPGRRRGGADGGRGPRASFVRPSPAPSPPEGAAGARGIYLGRPARAGARLASLPAEQAQGRVAGDSRLDSDLWGLRGKPRNDDHQLRVSVCQGLSARTLSVIVHSNPPSGHYPPHWEQRIREVK